jgi:hypothetical protein
VAHGRRTAHRARGLAGGVGEGEQGRARSGDGSPRRNPWRRGDAMGPEIATVVTSRRWWCKRLGGEESEGESVGKDGEGRGPFIVAGEGTPRRGRGKQPVVMALMPLKVGRLNEGLRGGIDGGRGSKGTGMTSRGAEWQPKVQKVVAAQSGSGGAGGR